MRSSLICILILANLAPGLCIDQDRCIINVDLPARMVQDVVVTDRLPIGLIYKNDSLNITGGYSFQEYVKGPNDGIRGLVIKWSFGIVNNSDNRDIKIDFLAVVADVPSNRAGVTLHPNRASLQWRDAKGLHSSSDEATQVEIVEPDLSIEEGIDPVSCRIGDNVSCKVSIYHSAESSSYAFDADLTQLLPSGLSYIPGSMEILSGPAAAFDDSHPSALVWHFESVDSYWTRSCPIVLRYNATATATATATAEAAGRQCIGSLLKLTSAKGCSPYERSYSSECRVCLDVEDRRNGLFISKTAPGSVCPGCVLNYTISYENSGEAVHGASIRELYDANTTFLSADPMPDAGTNDLWTIGDILQGGFGKTDVSVSVMSGVKDGTELNNTAAISSESSRAFATAKTTVRSHRPALEIYKRQSSDFIRPGESISYTISFANDGPGVAENVSVTDILDGHLRVSRSDPEPAKIWSDGCGTHLFWDASVLNTSRMSQGQQGRIEVLADLPQVPEHPGMDTVYNNYRIDSDNSEGAGGSLETFVVHSLFVRKEAEKDACAPDEILNYTITYGNDLAIEAKDAVIMDSLEGTNLIYASPAPDVEGGKLVWRLGTLKAHSEGTIRLTVMVRERPDILLLDKQLISGAGYVASSQRLYSSKEPDELVNRVEITASYLGKAESDSSISRVRILQYPGADMESIVKGSGDIDSVQSIEYSRNHNLSFDKQIRARYSPANISISGGHRTMTISSLFEDRTRAANRARNEALLEDYRYVSLLDHRTSLFLDENQTVFSSSSEFDRGEAEVGYQRHAPDGKGTMEVSEGYHGSFRLESRLDSYGSAATYTRSASGRGFVSSDERAADGGSGVISYERGSGLYSTEETVASDPAIRKYVNLSYAEENWSAGSLRAPYSSKWSEGMISGNSCLKSTISERIGYADLIKKDALMGSSSLAMSGEFSGVGSLEASGGNRSNEEMNINEMFAGSYRLDASLYMSGLQRFLGPHISITKKAIRLEAKTVLFRINVTNDGNKTLAPVEIVDSLPENVVFINSSLRPIINGRNISWWIVSLQPGDTRTIDLRAGLNGSAGAGNNRARAEGHYRNEIVDAQTSCGVIPQKQADLPGPGSTCKGSCPLKTYTDVGEDICSCGWDGDYYDYGYYEQKEKQRYNYHSNT